jgi:hypothetical protein
MELIGDFEDVKRLGEMLKSLHKGGAAIAVYWCPSWLSI